MGRGVKIKYKNTTITSRYDNFVVVFFQVLYRVIDIILNVSSQKQNNHHQFSANKH